ncbi:MAG: YdcF family protein [bacterium]|nr:YdcF family protein [bacterium]MDY2830625.1 YdcF family protein [Alphaproteobacteria bacterium]
MIKKILFYGIVISCFLLTIGFFGFIRTITHFKTPDDKKTDAIIVLTGGRNRIQIASTLLAQHKADKLFISGVGKDISLSDISQTQHLIFEHPQDIDIGHEASNTVGNALETKDWVKKNNIKSIRLVTSNYHIPRSLLEFKEQNPALDIVIHPVYSEKIQKKWWTSWQTFSLLFKEYNKFLYVYLRNKL